MKAKESHIFDRDPHDFYVEPSWAVEALLDAEDLPAPIWDPACGYGTVVKTAMARGLKALGTDLVDRGFGRGGQNFLAMSPKLVRHEGSIVTNPPFKHSVAFIDQALRLAPKAAFLVPLKFLASNTRHGMFTDRWPMSAVHVLSSRASMPPGQFIDPDTGLFAIDDPHPKALSDGSLKHRWRAGDKPGGGAVDFCWIVVTRGHQGSARINWIKKGGAQSRPYRLTTRKSAPEQALRRAG